MKVKNIMSSKIVTATLSTPFRELWDSIIIKHVHSLLVIDKQKKLLGIVTEEDLCKPLYPDYTHYIEDLTKATDFESMEETIREIVDLTAKNIMARRVVFTRPETPVMRALSRMLVHGIRQMPVLGDNDAVVGVISKGDIVRALFNKQLRENDETLMSVSSPKKKTARKSRVKKARKSRKS